MIKDSFYLSEPGNLERACSMTGLADDEIECLVGRFANHSHRAGKLRGEVVVYYDGRIVIRHHFHKHKKLWEDQYVNDNAERCDYEGFEAFR